ncbi:MAG: kinase/pyrophosphorylase [Rhodospirillaceae bacterium]|nr:kinase/pyrophosphorylase [Rhodospirillaceae bacterium]MYB14077.1 kinase/pyrophosphorylase [Rhodospirillaceae bacterium]MYI48150.1 kinase/pyrophosphorylase [Rhodospirillaceae bacterium]
MDRHHLYLISDSTGETVQSIGRACTVQFEQVEVVEHLWPMVRSPRALEIVIEELEEEPGLVLYTLLDRTLAETLEEYCKRRGLTCVSVIEPFIEVMATYFGAKSRDMPGRQHELDDEYFQRIDAMNYVMQHDDGQQTGNLEEADVVLVGVSRTSKTPTSIYLANRGIKAANVPIVPDQPLPDILFALNRPLVVGLTEDPRRLVDLRRSRMRQSLGDTETAYTDIAAVRKEVADARRLFGRYGWPVIDVTRRSIEETAAAILRLVRDRERRHEEGADADLLQLGGRPDAAPLLDGAGGAPARIESGKP